MIIELVGILMRDFSSKMEEKLYFGPRYKGQFIPKAIIFIERHTISFPLGTLFYRIRFKPFPLVYERRSTSQWYNCPPVQRSWLHDGFVNVFSVRWQYPPLESRVKII